MSNFANLVSQINNASKRGRPFVKVSTNTFLESILMALYKHQFIGSFTINKQKNQAIIFFRYKQGHSAFSEIKLFSTPGRMLSLTMHKFVLKSKKRFQEYFFFTTGYGIKVYNSFDIVFLKKNISLGFLLFSVRA